MYVDGKRQVQRASVFRRIFYSSDRRVVTVSSVISFDINVS